MEKWRWENAVEGKYLGRKVVFWKWVLVVSLVSGLVIILFSVRNVKGGFIVVVLMCLGRWVYYHVGMSLSVEYVLDEDVLEEVEKFCYLVDMISCYGESSQAVSAKIGSAWKKFGALVVC